jgi:uncharacterized protein YbaP (TraB family)
MHSGGLRLTAKAVIAAAFLSLFCSASAAFATPGLWVVKSPTVTIYLFGTIHLLQQNQDWETPAVREALAASDQIWFEAPDFEDTATAQKLIPALGYDAQHPLSTLLPPKALARLRRDASAAGLPQGEATLEPMRPWLAALALADAQMVHAGFDPNAGVEHALLDQWRDSRKPVRGFETLEQQLHFFADMPPQLQEEVLENTLEEFDQGVEKLKAIVAAWMKGDQKTITGLIIDELRKPFPDLYRTLIVARNERWAERIAGMLKENGVRFVAVGAGHLAGPESVQTKLSARGIPVELVSVDRAEPSLRPSR